MNRELTQRLHRDYIKASKLRSYISHGIFILIIIAALILILIKDWTLIPIWIAGIVWMISFIVFTFIIPTYEYRSFSFEVFEEELEIQSGIWFRSNILVPMNRVQHVELGSGPIMRKYKLASIKVVTAAREHEISGLHQADAQALKHKIGELAKVDEKHE